MVAWLRDERGVRIPLRREGTLLGSDPAYGIVVDSSSVGRRHVLLLPGKHATELIALTRAGLLLNGSEPGERADLVAGDRLVLGGVSFVHEQQPDAAELPSWTVELSGNRYGITSFPFSIGGADDDDLRVASWPPHAVRLLAATGSLVMEPALPVTACGIVTAEHCSLKDRDTVALDGVRLRVLRAPGNEPETLGQGTAPSSAVLELHPNGGLLMVRIGVDHAVWLGDRRCDLVAVLLRPPHGLRPGDGIPDAKLLDLVWPRQSATRAELNTLVYRVRQTFARAGIDGARVIVRDATRRTTRFALAAGGTAQVVG